MVKSKLSMKHSHAIFGAQYEGKERSAPTSYCSADYVSDMSLQPIESTYELSDAAKLVPVQKRSGTSIKPPTGLLLLLSKCRTDGR